MLKISPSGRLRQASGEVCRLTSDHRARNAGAARVRWKGMKNKAGAASGRLCLETTRDRSGQVDRGCRTPREGERPGAPGSASATPARQRDRQRPTHVEHRRAQAVRRPFGVPWRVSSVDPVGFSTVIPSAESGAILGRSQLHPRPGQQAAGETRLRDANWARLTAAWIDGAG